jgi:5-methylcytosine-specific restriction endonuclease McrA
VVAKSRWNGIILTCKKVLTTEEIRRIVFERDEYHCVKCGELVTFETGHMDEIIPRGKGGKVSVENCQVLCARCHIGPGGKHDRRPRWTKIKLDKTISVW